MAYHWRIRHKLMLGLCLVVGIILLILGGTYYGMARYRYTMRSIGSKLAELEKTDRIKEAVNSLKTQAETSSTRLEELLAKIQAVDKALDSYEAKLEDTLNHHRDPDKGVQEKLLISALRKELIELANNAKIKLPQSYARPQGNSESPMDVEQIKIAITSLVTDSFDLASAIYQDLESRRKDAASYYRNTLVIVIGTSTLGILLLSYFGSFFYGWVFYPIRDLQKGAQRIAQGNFQHHIDVHSGDEMEDLAGAFNDMTGRLREMYRDLETQVNERSRQLVRSERLASVGFLAAGVAHEINNPLHAIALCSEALERRLISLSFPSTEDGQVVANYLKTIQDEAFRCKSITQRLLDLSRGGERRREPTDLGELIQAVLDVVQHLPSCKGKQINFQPSGKIIAWVNPQEIKPVVLNLVVNALESMDDGGLLAISLSQRDGTAEMKFTDSGCGMTPEVLENIFEPFFTRSRTGKGTGLGLSISHRVIIQHGGEIEATSPGVDKGSTFKVILPLQPAETVKEEQLGNAAA